MPQHFICRSVAFVLVSAMLLTFVGAVQGENYAILFNGGIDRSKNTAWYYGETLAMYRVLKDDLHFDPQNIFICASDGLDPASDYTDVPGQEWPFLHSSDWSTVVDATGHVWMGTAASLEYRIRNLGTSRYDLFYLWTTDHGGEAEPHDPSNTSESLSGWGATDISDANLASWVGTVAARRQAFVFNQCFSGGMLDDLGIVPTDAYRSGMSATQHWQESWHDGINTDFPSAVREAVSNRGYTSTQDIFVDARAHDWFAHNTWPTTAIEDPQFVGGDIDLAVARETGLSPAPGVDWNVVAWTVLPTIRRSVTVNGSVNIPSGTAAQAGFLTVDGDAGYPLILQAGGSLHSVYQLVGQYSINADFIQQGGSNTVDEDLIVGGKWGRGFYDMMGGALTARRIYVGDQEGIGRMTHTGGNVNVQTLYVANSAAMTEYNLEGSSALLSTGDSNIGITGSGCFNLRRGTHRVTNTLAVATDEHGTGHYYQTGGATEAGAMVVGQYGIGTLDQSAGTTTVSTYFSVGQFAHSTGTVWLRGTASLQARDQYIGDWGTGELLHDAGNNMVTDTLYVGVQPGSAGTYRLRGSAATLNAANEYIGRASHGEFVHTSGSNTVTNAIIVGAQAGVTGTYTLSGGTLGATDLTVGDAGQGEVVHSGGTATLSGTLALATTTGGSGTYRLSSTGELSAANVRAGVAATSDFYQTGGTLLATSSLALGWQTGVNGTYHLDGGSARCDGWASIGYQGIGRVQQTDGALRARDLYVGDQPGATGEYSLAGGELSADADAFIGNGGTGSITQSNTSTMRVGGSLYIGHAAGSHGTYTISDGTLDVRNGTLVVGNAGSGALAVHGGTVIADVLVRYDGGSLTYGSSSGTIRINRLANFGYAPSFGCSLQFGHSGGVGNGSYTVHSDSSLTVIGGLTVGYNAPASLDQSADRTNVNVGGLTVGAMPGSDATYVFGGSFSRLAASKESIGQEGSGRMNQTGGSNTVSGPIDIGSYGNGVYNLIGGSLQAGMVTLGGGIGTGSGRLNWTGGTFSATDVIVATGGRFEIAAGDWSYGGNLLVCGGTSELGPRALTLDGPTAHGEITAGMLGAGKICIGAAGHGAAIQSGGIVAAGSDLCLGRDAGANGAYAVRDGLLIAEHLAVGKQGVGEFHQEGGSTLISSAVEIGGQPGSNGTYTALGGSMTTARLSVGEGGNGTLSIRHGEDKDVTAEITVSSELHFGPHAVLDTESGAHIHMTGSPLTNTSTSPANLAGLAKLRLIFEGGDAIEDTFEAAGKDCGPLAEGFTSNFVLGALQIGGADVGHVRMVDVFDNQPTWDGSEALYVDSLVIKSPSTLDLGGLNLYYRSFSGDPGAVTLDGGTMTMVPEPTTLMLTLSALAVLVVVNLARSRSPCPYSCRQPQYRPDQPADVALDIGLVGRQR